MISNDKLFPNPDGHLTKRERENLHRTFSYDNYVKSFARWAAFYGFLIGAGMAPAAILAAAMQDEVQPGAGVLFIVAIMFGASMSGMLGTLAVWVRAAEFKEMMVEYRLDEFSAPVIQMNQPAPVAERQTKLNHEPYALERQDKTVAYGGQTFTFSGKQLDSLLQWHRQGYVKIRRDANAEGPGFASIGITSANYSRAQMVLRGRDLIDVNSEWTAKGVNWLENE